MWYQKAYTLKRHKPKTTYANFFMKLTPRFELGLSERPARLPPQRSL